MWSHILPTLCSNGTPCSLVYVSRHVVSHSSDSVFEWHSLFSSLYFSPCGLTFFRLCVRMALLVLEFIFPAMWCHILPTLCSNGTPCSRVYISRHVVSHSSDSVFEWHSLFSSLYFPPCGLTSFRLCVRTALLILEFIFLAMWPHILPTLCSNGTPYSRVYISRHVASHPSDSVFERYSLFSSLYFSPCGLTSFRLCSNGTPYSRVYISRHVASHPFDSLFERHSLFSSLYFSPCGLTSFRLCVRTALLVLEFIFLAMWSHILPTLCSNGTPYSLVYISRHVASHPFDSLFERHSLFSSLYFSPCGLTSFRLCVRTALLVLEFIFLAMWSHILPTLCSNGTPYCLVYISRYVVSHPSDSVFERHSLFSSLYFSPCGLTSFRLSVRMALLALEFIFFAMWSQSFSSDSVFE